MVNGDSGKYAALIKVWLEDIIYGKVDHPWGVVVDEKDVDADVDMEPSTPTTQVDLAAQVSRLQQEIVALREKFATV
jgi:hypothetical protein